MHLVGEPLLLPLTIALVLGIVAERLAQRTAIPDIVFFLAIGLVLGPSALKVIDFSSGGAVTSLILTFGTIVLVFEGGRLLKLEVMRSIWLGTTLLATVGVILTAGVMTVAIHYILGAPMLQAALAGCVIASTDPAAIVPLLQRVHVAPRLAQLLISESALNDATGAILTFLVAGLLLMGQADIPRDIGQFVVMVVGGLLIGTLAALASCALVAELRHRPALFPDLHHSTIALVLLILTSYVAAQAVGASGIMAVFAAGIVAGNRASLGLPIEPDRETAHHFYLSTNALLLRILVFVILGASVDLAVVGAIALPGLAVMAVFLFVARPLAVFVSLSADRIGKWSPREMLFAAWVRETGVVPAALAGLLQSMNVPGARLITAIVFMAVLVTIGGQAATTGFWARKLGLQQPVSAARGRAPAGALG